MKPAAARPLATSFGRYLGVGLVATAAHWALLALLVEVAHVPAWLASGAGAVLGAQLAFFGNRHYTFAHRGDWAPAWWRFMGTATLGALLGMAIVGAGVALGLYYLLAQALATGAGVLLTFAINRGWTFSG
ncbi:MAG: GtrA family protein [Burkholderiales bacterium]|nr:GtrA family protein [Burkholderiales bacterium]